MPQNENLVDKLESRLPETGRRLVEAVRSVAEAGGLRAYIVGGTVRDLLLDLESLDVDIVVEGDAVALAREVAESSGARLAKTTAFGTATLKSEGFSLDLATARVETYAKPGALPTVRPSDIDDDLHRRDFAINSMAVQMTLPARGKLLDPTGGEDDLRRGLVRVLHDRSFEDDATRIVRAVRYEQRFGFRIEERTLDLLQRDIRYLDAISGTRIRQELARTFAEPEPEHALARMQELGVLAAIHPALTFGPRQADALHRLREIRAPPVAVWPVLFWDSPVAALPDAIRRLALTRAQATAVDAIPAAKSAASTLPHHASGVVRTLEALPLATAYALAAIGDDVRVKSFVSEARGVRSILRGDDLIELGVTRGPDLALVLDMLRTAKLDGEVTSRADEERLVEQFLARETLGLA